MRDDRTGGVVAPRLALGKAGGQGASDPYIPYGHRASGKQRKQNGKRKNGGA